MNDNMVKVTFTPLAWTKMWTLVDAFDSEVAWAGLCSRTAERQFLVEDILVHKQTVTGGTVRTDPAEYDEWLDQYRENDPDTFFKIALHGHSHYNFAAYPSGKDAEVQRDYTAWLDGDMFYIFVIANRRREFWIKVYDKATNMMYWESAVEINVADSGFDYQNFIQEAKSLVTDVGHKQKCVYQDEGDDEDGDESR